METWALVGLGNPEPKYDTTRHNVGFMAIDTCVSKWTVSPFKTKKNLIDYTHVTLGGTKLILAKPQTYMNLSGQAVQWLASFYKIPMSQIIVIYDDIALPFNTLRIRKQGSAGGHNGIKSIIQHLGQDFPRIKMGIQPEHPVSDLSNFVLAPFNKKELKVVSESLSLVPQIIEMIMNDGCNKAMNQYN
jgi:peptidyl-tRNA hydrolase, PTH1 family